MTTPVRATPVPFWLIAVLTAFVGLVVLCGLASVVNVLRPSSGSHPTGGSKSSDVTYDCAKDDNKYLPSVRFDIRVHNSSRVTRSYVITLNAFDTTGTRIGQGVAFVSSLPAGSDATEKGVVLVSGSLFGSAKCSVEVS